MSALRYQYFCRIHRIIIIIARINLAGRNVNVDRADSPIDCLGERLIPRHVGGYISANDAIYFARHERIASGLPVGALTNSICDNLRRGRLTPRARRPRHPFIRHGAAM